MSGEDAACPWSVRDAFGQRVLAWHGDMMSASWLVESLCGEDPDRIPIEDGHLLLDIIEAGIGVVFGSDARD